MAQNAAQLSETVTIYTNADEAVKAELDPMISVLSKSKFIIDTRKINRLTAKDESSVSVEFEDGSTQEERFLVHNPLTSPQGPFVGQLGLEVTAMGDIKADPPFFATNVQGVYAVGDCSTPYKVIPSAISSGCNAAVAAAAEVQAAKYAR
jgi:thioredoxin reductase